MASRIMSRTTIGLDPTVLRELKRRARVEAKSLGRLASEVLSAALEHRPQPEPPPPLAWCAHPRGALVDLDDKEAVRRALEGS
jgi:hypothetical protein